MGSNIVIQCDDGSVVLSSVEEGDLAECVKNQVIKAVSLWKPMESDLMVFSTQNESQLKAPLTKDMLDKVKPFSPQRRGDMIVFSLPVFVVSYRIQQEEANKYRDRSVIVISPLINQEIKEQLEAWTKELTAERLEAQSGESEEEEEEGTEEGT
ncbi:MAG: DUF2286 domain-containing protein [Candidatus Marsarchaeota archaeon]|nr:DUF2286 domain-containing protein [Candidatus Marsarchaeota archaeon]